MDTPCQRSVLDDPQRHDAWLASSRYVLYHVICPICLTLELVCASVGTYDPLEQPRGDDPLDFTHPSRFVAGLGLVWVVRYTETPVGEFARLRVMIGGDWAMGSERDEEGYREVEDHQRSRRPKLALTCFFLGVCRPL